GITADATHAYFETAQAIPVGDDPDTQSDVYERRPDQTVHRVSTGANGVPAWFVAATADGSRAMFRTEAAIAGLGDANATQDIYEKHVGGAVRLISGGKAGAGPVSSARYSED